MREFTLRAVLMARVSAHDLRRSSLYSRAQGRITGARRFPWVISPRCFAGFRTRRGDATILSTTSRRRGSRASLAFGIGVTMPAILDSRFDSRTLPL